MTPTTALSAVRATGGAVMLLAPGTVCRLYGQPPTPAAQGVVRVLGARHVVQAAVTLARPDRLVVGGGALVDLAHAASAVVWAALAREHRRPGLTSAAAATVLAAAARRALPRRPPGGVGRPHREG